MDELRRRFRIREGARVLDVGCGARPFPLATHLADLHLEDASERFGFPIPMLGRPFTVCSVEALPFGDHSFDFVHCSHVLEHVRDPAAACRELMRVGRAGYVECPRSWVEYAFHSVDHRWLVDHEADTLVFREKLDEERRDHLGIQYAIFRWLEDPAFRAHWDDPATRAVRNVELYWRGGFAFRVLRRARRKNAGRDAWFYARSVRPRRERRDRDALRAFLVAELERSLCR